MVIFESLQQFYYILALCARFFPRRATLENHIKKSHSDRVYDSDLTTESDSDRNVHIVCKRT